MRSHRPKDNKKTGGESTSSCKPYFSPSTRRRRLNNLGLILSSLYLLLIAANKPHNGRVESALLVEGTWGAEIHPLVAPLPDEIVVTKRGISAFANSELGLILRASNDKELLLAGVATRFVVEGTARDAFELGYRFSVLEDCCASSSVEMHEAAIDFMSRLGEITTSQEWLIANGG